MMLRRHLHLNVDDAALAVPHHGQRHAVAVGGHLTRARKITIFGHERAAVWHFPRLLHRARATHGQAHGAVLKQAFSEVHHVVGVVAALLQVAGGIVFQRVARGGHRQTGVRVHISWPDC